MVDESYRIWGDTLNSHMLDGSRLSNDIVIHAADSY